MSSKPTEPRKMSKAELKFREAFDRLKYDKPDVLPKGTKLSQNNVAKEAGVDPSALRRSRFPLLVEEIQAWLEEHKEQQLQTSPRQMMLAQRTRNRNMRERLDALERQRDDALSRLVDAHARIVELTLENQRLRLRLPSIEVKSVIPFPT
jgi:hypothetical protein